MLRLLWISALLAAAIPRSPAQHLDEHFELETDGESFIMAIHHLTQRQRQRSSVRSTFRRLSLHY